MSPWLSLVTVSALILHLALTINVGRARAQYKVAPPEMSGDPGFERVLRQQTPLEQLVLFLPGLWLFSQFVRPTWGAGLRTVWIIGRILYAWGYYQSAEKRTLGFGISSLVTLILLEGSRVGIILTLFQTSLS